MPTSQSILITGAGSGIGRGVALYLARAGYRIIATDLSLEAAQSTIDEILKLGGQGSAYAMDVTSEAATQAVFDSEGEIHGIINNAGIQHIDPIEDFPKDKWETLIKILLVGPAIATGIAVKHMRENGYGRIINIGSIHGLVASPYKSAYISAKHGLLGLSKTVALETADTDITINTVCPAYVKTPLVEKQIADQARTRGLTEDQVINEVMLKPMPKKAFISFEELGGTCEYLLSPAAKNMTGQTLVLDGGWTCT